MTTYILYKYTFMTIRLKLILLLVLPVFQVQAQRSAQQPIQNIDFRLHAKGTTQWFDAKTSTARVGVSEFFMTYRSALGLSYDDSFVLNKVVTDEYGWEHHRMQQYHKGIKVLGAEYILHTKNGYVEKANGKLARSIHTSVQARINSVQAIEEALSYLPAKRYMWDDPKEEAQLKKIKNDEQATYYPSPELVLVDREYPKHTGHYILAYVMDVFQAEPFRKERVLVEAYYGHIIQSFNTLDHQMSHGTANTRYNGERPIMTDSVAPNLFFLRDLSRGRGIYMDNDDDCVEDEIFRDDDNYWNNYNENQDEVATDIMFGTQAAYDYFLNHYGRDSYDDNGIDIHARVHFGTDYSNAAWTGSAMLFGDGDGDRYHPFTSFDIVVHEYMHAVTEHTADLVYRNESGALNESFSDIFSKVVEHEYLPERFSWRLAHDIFVDSTANDAIRVMDDPNTEDDPAYYKGEHWSNSGRVHTNSGVMNYWFTLLCDGKVGTNEVGNDYDITPVGFEKMGEICYRMLTTYLTSTSNYNDAVAASLQAARDIFGGCSPEVSEISEAWHAVGLGNPLQENDIELKASFGNLYCDVVDSLITLDVFHNACEGVIPQGAVLDFYYQINEDSIVHEQDTLAFDLNGFESYTYTFDSLLTLTNYGEHTLRLRVEYAQDSTLINNKQSFTFQHNQEEDIDILLFTPNIYRDDCGFYEDKYFSFFMAYEKCEKLEADYSLPIKIEVDSVAYYTEYTLEANNILGGSTSNYLSFRLDMPEGITGSGKKEFLVTIMDENDIDSTNNTSKRTKLLYAPFELDFIRDFSNPEPSWAASIDDGFNSSFSIEDFDGDAKLVATGDKLEDLAWYRPGCEGLIEDVFNNHSIVITEVPICVDLVDCGTPQLEFDLIQTKGNTDYLSAGVDTEFTVMARVSASEIGASSSQVISDYIINPVMGEEFHHAIDLSTTSLENMILTIELFAFSDEEGLLNGDNNIIDNIQITGCSTVNVKEIVQPEFSIYPNPSSNLIFIEGEERIINMQLMDNTGKLIQIYMDNTRQIELNAALEAGIYYLKIATTKGTDYLKLVKI